MVENLKLLCLDCERERRKKGSKPLGKKLKGIQIGKVQKQKKIITIEITYVI